MTLFENDFNLSQRMTQELGRAIVGGKYNGDEGLPTEADLCAQFGISRSAVREGVKMLSAKGLISSRQRQGIRILPEENWNIFDPDVLKWLLERRPTLEVVREFLQLRLAIEPEAASLAAKYAEDAEIDAIEDALERMRVSPLERSDADQNANSGFLEADIAFHVSILYASKNRFYIRLRDFIQTALNVSIRYTNMIKVDHDSIFDEHAKVFNAIKARNPERARNAMLFVIDEALTFIEDSLEETGAKARSS